MVQPFAGPIFEQHRAAGRPIVLATTTPYDLVKPLADRLGLDDVVATRYGVNDDGTYDGTLVGPFVWAAGKLEAVRTWAGEHGIDLKESYAYSDSFYDAPLLGAVGTPIVVNPDPRMVLMAIARRWPILNLDVSPGVVKIPVLGIELQQLAMQFSRPSLMPYVRFDIAGVEHIPAAGPAILVANHRSYFDSAGDVGRHRPQRPHRALPRQEGGVRRPDRRPAGHGHGRHPRRSRHRLRRAAAGRRRRAGRRRGRGGHAAGHDPAVGRRSSTRS